MFNFSANKYHKAEQTTVDNSFNIVKGTLISITSLVKYQTPLVENTAAIIYMK